MTQLAGWYPEVVTCLRGGRTRRSAVPAVHGLIRGVAAWSVARAPGSGPRGRFPVLADRLGQRMGWGQGSLAGGEGVPGNGDRLGEPAYRAVRRRQVGA